MHNFIPSDRYFAYLTWPEVHAMADKANTVIIQPLGAVEQHGPHLPLIVDAAISVGVLGHALAHLDKTIPAYALPPLYYGKSNEHDGFAGTITLSASTLLALLWDIGESLYASGFRKWILMNSHGGQPQVLEILARDMHQKYPDFQVFPFFTWSVPHCAAELLSPLELEQGIHAGDAETSLIMALLPDHVHGDRRVKEYPQGVPPESSLLSLEGKLPFAWLTREISQSGVMGDATTASKEKGDHLLASLAQGWVQAIMEVYYFKPPTFDQPR